jgi:hypothetical protein
MGTWRIETGIYGEQERWRPDHIGDWPYQASDAPLSDGLLPPPCPECGGELLRRVTFPRPDKAIMHYEVRHYRGPHGIVRPGGQGPSHAVAGIGDVVQRVREEE